MDTNANCFDTTTGVRTIPHMSPAVMAAVVLSAQKRGLNLREWLDRAVANLIADEDAEAATPWSGQTAELFANVANCSPELLHGRWSLLYERVLLERSLWHEPSVTVGEIEDSELAGAPYIVPARLRKAWPRLVAAVFLFVTPAPYACSTRCENCSMTVNKFSATSERRRKSALSAAVRRATHDASVGAGAVNQTIAPETSGRHWATS